MATYVYKCKQLDCDIYNIEFEVTQSMNDAVLTKCPDCHNNSLVKIIVPSGGFRIGGKGVNKPTAHWGS